MTSASLRKREVTGNVQVSAQELSSIEEIEGSLERSGEDDKLMHSVLENDQDTIDKGHIIEDATNQGVAAFTPDMMFEQLVKDYGQAEQIYGERILRQLTGYSSEYLERNIKIPEFQKLVQENLRKNVKQLKKEGLLDKDDQITEKAITLASVVMYTEELDNIMPKGISGEREYKKQSHYGEKGDVKPYRTGDRYKDLALKKSIKKAIRRGHADLSEKDLEVFERQSKGQVYVIYALDASGSMKGRKIGACKKAGIALCYKAIEERDKAGLLIFGETIEVAVEPTLDFPLLLNKIVKARASKQTDLAATIRHAISMFPSFDVTKHLILLTDALPTAGAKPEQETLRAVSAAKEAGITISLIGINLDKKGRKLAERIVEISNAKLYVLRDVEDVDKIVLEDYYAARLSI